MTDLQATPLGHGKGQPEVRLHGYFILGTGIAHVPVPVSYLILVFVSYLISNIHDISHMF